MSTDTALGRELSTLAFWSQPASNRAPLFAELRATEPVTFLPPPDFGLIPAEMGYWAVTRFDDVREVSRNPELFCSGQGITFESIPAEMAEMSSSFLVMDAPRHTALRSVVSAEFTPRRVAHLQTQIAERARVIVEDFMEAGTGDAVADLATKLPLWTISMMMGVPDSLRADMHDAVEAMVSAQIGNTTAEANALETIVTGAGTLHSIATDLAAERRKRPTDDLWSAFANASIDGQPLPDMTLGSIFLLFAIAGNDTSRTTIVHGISAMAQHPDQWTWFRADPDSRLGSTVEEIIRYATPVIQFRRTTTQDTTLSGQRIAAGDHVVIFYESANRDEHTFERAAEFAAARNPNPHVGFGGGGPHFCLGAHLARTQVRAMFRHLADVAEGFQTGEQVIIPSNFINAVASMPVQIDRGRR
jgi:cytochrome P450